MKIAFRTLVLLMLAGSVFLYCGNGDDDDDDCDGNDAPALSNVHLVVDGTAVFDGFELRPEDKIEFYLDYSDGDCNLNGGSILFQWGEAEEQAIAQISTDSPCEGAFPEQELSFFKTAKEAGTFAFSVTVTDSCGERSNRVDGEVAVGYAPRILDAGWSKTVSASGEKVYLEITVCDEDSDLFGGEVLLYKHGNPAPLFSPMKWSQAGVGPDTITNDCSNAPTFELPLTPEKTGTLCVDVFTTDAAGHGSDRFGYDGDGVCIQVEEPETE